MGVTPRTCCSSARRPSTSCARPPVPCSHCGRDSPLLTDPLTNKGTAFTGAERRRLHIEGRLPSRIETLDEQAARVVANLRARADPLERYRYLSGVQNDNETLFYRVLLDDLDELVPVVYTPTVGQACLEWSRLFERPRGLYLSAAQHAGRLCDLLRSWSRRPGIIVVTDGGRILGLGDLGANGMPIPIGKLALYTACAGVPPSACLPITLDVGTNAESIRNDPLYLGDRRPRLEGREYEAFVHEFVAATQEAFPGVVLQFEDFNNACAFRLLQRYRGQICCFNDDIQGTGAMGLAGLYTASRITGRPLHAQRLLFVGAGEACLGIGSLVVAAMQREGLSDREARARCLFVDSKGPVVTERSDLSPEKRVFAQTRPMTASLVEAIEAFRPTALIGASTQGGIFTEPALAAMARLNDRPVVFALSNPTSKAECTAEHAYAWTGGRALFASGSPFGAVTLDGRVQATAQANNAFIFPGVGFGLLLSGARHVDDELFFSAARALAGAVTEGDLRRGLLFPPAARLREVALAVATAVAGTAFELGLASRPRPADLVSAAAEAMYVPRY